MKHLQANWRFLHLVKNGVAKEHRQHLLGLLKGMLYAVTIEDLIAQYDVTCADPIANTYATYLRHIGEVQLPRNSINNLLVCELINVYNCVSYTIIIETLLLMFIHLMTFV